MRLSKSTKQATILYITTILGTVLGVLASVINTRSLSPESYGDVRYVNNLIGFISGLLLLGYFTSGSRLLALAKSKQEAKEIKGSMLLVLLVTIIGLIILLIVCFLVHRFWLHRDFSYLFLYIIPVCYSSILLNYINTSSMGDNSISTIAMARLMPHLLYVIVSVFLYSIIPVTNSVVLILQNGIAVLVLVSLICYNGFSFTNLRCRIRNLQEENSQYGLHVYLGSLFTLSVPYLAGVSLGVFNLNNTLVGFYSLALSMTTPLGLVPNVIGTTFYKRFALQDRIEQRVLVFTFAISIVTLAIFSVLIFPLVDILYDDAYSTVAIYACFLGIGALIHGLGDVFYRFLGAHGKGKEIRNVSVLVGVISIIGYTLGVYIWGINAAIVTRILVGCIYCIGMYCYYHMIFVSNHEKV